MNLEEAVRSFLANLSSIGFTGDTDVATVPAGPITYEPSGWSFTHKSNVNCPRSKGVDELKAELREKGHARVADLIPDYHCAAFWLKSQFPYTLFLNLHKVKAHIADFGVFAALFDDEVEQNLSDNVFAAGLQLQALFLGGGGDVVAKGYRGQKDKVGFVKVVWDGDNASADFSPSAPPLLRPDVPIDRPGFAAVSKFERVYDGWSGEFKAKPSGVIAGNDHVVYDMWWDASTDENITRYWRNWAAAVGANVSPA